MVSAIEYQVTDSELFALLLEHHHILKFRPELNKALRGNSYNFEMRYSQKEDTISFAPNLKGKSGMVIKKFKSRKSALTYLQTLLIMHEIPLDQISFHGISQDRLIQSVDFMEEFAESNMTSLESVVRKINPFYKGSFLVYDEIGTSWGAYIKGGEFKGISSNMKSIKRDSSNIEEELEYNFDSEYGLSQIISFYDKGMLHVEKLES